MVKRKYTKPVAETIKIAADDIIRTSALQDTINGTKATKSASSNYEDWFNATAGGAITLN